MPVVPVAGMPVGPVGMVIVIAPWTIHAVDVVLVDVGELIIPYVVLLVEDVGVRPIHDSRIAVARAPLRTAAAGSWTIGPIGPIVVAGAPLRTAAAGSGSISYAAP